MAPKGLRQAAQTTKDIRDAVQEELEFDPMVDSFGIAVKNINAMLTTAANNALTLTITVPGGVEASASSGDIGLTERGRHRDRSSMEGAGVKNVRDYVVVMR